MSPQPSPPNTGRYQSQLLNFLNRQSQRLRDQGSILLRKLKVATLWGGQIALYPIYALFQASRIAGRQIGTTFQQALYYLRPAPPVPADQPIQQVLDALTPGKSNRNHRRRISARPPQIIQLTTNHTIQAIASSCETRRLLIVTTTNESLDLLTDTQQQQIQARIVWELASYWKLWRRWQAYQASMRLPGQQSQPALRSETRFVISDRPQLVAPVRLFYQLMAWVQQGTIASQINLFAEIQRIEPPPQIDWFQPHLGQLPTDAIIRPQGMTQFDWQAWSETLPDNNQIARLLKAAIRYFFGQTAQAFRSAVSMPQIADPWSDSIDVDIVDRAEIVPTTTIQIPIPVPATSVLKLAPSTEPPISPTVKITRALPTVAPRQSFKQQLGRLIKRTIGQVSQRSNIPVAPPTLAAESAADGAELTWNSIFSHDLTTTLIDTVATPIGYVKHPLEQLLNWLDQLILWFEQPLGRLWQWIKQNSQNLIQWMNHRSTK